MAGHPKKNIKGSVPMPVIPALNRTVVVELIPTKEEEEKLRELGDLCAKLWNQANYERRRQFFEGGPGGHNVDLKGTYAKWYYEYNKKIGSATAQQILRKNDEAWKAFFGLLKAKREGRLPSFVEKPNPPGYWKEEESDNRIEERPIQNR